MTFPRQLMGLGSLLYARMHLSLIYARRVAVSVALAALAMASTGAAVGTAGGPPVMRRTAAVVRGVVWKADNSPFPNPKVRLRNLHSGRVEASAVGTEVGQFNFSQVEGGTYLVELVDDNGKVIAVGQTFRVDSGDTIATFVRLPAPQSWYSGVFGNTAAAVLAAASSAGLTAIGTQAPPASPQ
jgi:hypothetical protein